MVLLSVVDDDAWKIKVWCEDMHVRVPSVAVSKPILFLLIFPEKSQLMLTIILAHELRWGYIKRVYQIAAL